MRDAAFMIAVMCALELIRWGLGTPVAYAVAVTLLVCCVAFLWHAGSKEKR